ncbi:hypothetical protein PSECIP111951_04189 [Pseudoalteromonas holothuriae]|uniref:Uncharacterized protein n=1 Tax=Pseudoalteromonas holothuriae TaxID=2963714 RepID=A0ABM9GNT0_9GAMM|nr:hypothetical protein [Pseudoalteromonas sp. CIP111951]CAH9068548.1 hypothetical protein PSECIP111951_04189 [Pseudoalteromonas sp. CIP111951]
MAKIKIPEGFRGKLGSPMAMDVHWVDVKLKSGELYKKLVVRNSRYITGRHDDQNGEGDLPFSTEDIEDIRRQSIVPYWLYKLLKP